jgi:FtsP/CotA-like multicopper oxidase with cupredoxin domain
MRPLAPIHSAHRAAIVGMTAMVVAGAAAWGARGDDDSPFAALRDIVAPCFDNSPVKAPFLQAMPIPPAAQRVASPDANVDRYEIHELRGEAEIIPGIKTPIWGYADATTNPGVAITPGPTILARRLVPVDVRFVNNLPPNDDPTGIIDRGSHEDAHPHRPSSTVVHMHGINADHRSDGYPDFADGHEHRKDPGQSMTHHYPNNEQNRASTYWYHDHSVHITGNHVFRGLKAFYILTDPQEERLNLPKGYGVHDIPLAIQDVMIDPASGRLIYDNCERDGAYGDVMTVNGKQQPFFKVAARKYRFRILNGSDARQYRLVLRPAARLSDPSAEIPFFVIGSDQGLLPNRETTTWVHAAPAERFDIVVDFSAHAGKRLVLANTLVSSGNRKLFPVLAFDVGPPTPDESTVPLVLSEDHAVQPPSRTRYFEFDEEDDNWVINERIWNPQRVDAFPLVDTTEQWTLETDDDDWGHPVHIHLGKFRIVSVSGRARRPGESGWKDTVWVGPEQTVKVIHEFWNFGGKFAFHCHNASHEDHDMMSQFSVQGGIFVP